MQDARSTEDLFDLADAAHLRASLAQRELFSLIVQLDRRELWRDSGARDMAQWLWMRYGISDWKARRWIACAHALEELPLISEAFACGELGVDKVVELTRFATPTPSEGSSHGPPGCPPGPSGTGETWPSARPSRRPGRRSGPVPVVVVLRRRPPVRPSGRAPRGPGGGGGPGPGAPGGAGPRDAGGGRSVLRPRPPGRCPGGPGLRPPGPRPRPGPGHGGGPRLARRPGVGGPGLRGGRRWSDPPRDRPSITSWCTSTAGRSVVIGTGRCGGSARTGSGTGRGRHRLRHSRPNRNLPCQPPGSEP